MYSLEQFRSNIGSTVELKLMGAVAKIRSSQLNSYTTSAFSVFPHSHSHRFTQA